MTTNEDYNGIFSIHPNWLHLHAWVIRGINNTTPDIPCSVDIGAGTRWRMRSHNCCSLTGGRNGWYSWDVSRWTVRLSSDISDNTYAISKYEHVQFKSWLNQLSLYHEWNKKAKEREKQKNDELIKSEYCAKHPWDQSKNVRETTMGRIYGKGSGR